MFGKYLIVYAALLMLSACTPREQAFVPASSPPALTQNTFLPGDGAELPLKHWDAHGHPHAMIVALHGFNDYSHSFAEMAQYFASRGIETYAYDQRGFGKTPETGIWAGEANLVSDTEQMLKAVHKRHPNVPVFLLGESMGGAVVIETLASGHVPYVRGAILSAPAVWGGEHFDPFLRAALWSAAHTFPAHALTGEGMHIQASDNIPMLRALTRDPLVLKSTRIDAAYGVVHLMDHAYTDADKLHLPLLVLYGEHDEIIPPEPVHAFADQLPALHSVIIYRQGWHLLFRDLEAHKVWRDMAHWVLARGLQP